MSQPQKTNELIANGKNGVVCWFYVYKKRELDTLSKICGIVIIKQLTDNNKIFFYTKTNFTFERSDDGRGPGYFIYENDDLIYKFIATEPTDKVIKKIFDDNKQNEPKFILGNYSKLHNFLTDLINNNFEMIENTTYYESIGSSYSNMSDS